MLLCVFVGTNEHFLSFFLMLLSTEGAAGAIARLPRVPVRLPLRVLRRDPAQLHPDAQPHLVCVPAEHAPA